MTSTVSALDKIFDEDDELLSEGEAAALAHMRERTFRQRRYEGRGPAVILIGKRPLYRRSAVLSWLLENERPSGAASPVQAP